MCNQNVDVTTYHLMYVLLIGNGKKKQVVISKFMYPQYYYEIFYGNVQEK